MSSQIAQTMRVDFVSDIMCPWCVIGYLQLRQAAVETGFHLDIHWHPFELNPKMPDGGQNILEHVAKKYGNSPAKSMRTRDRLVEMARAFGFTFNFTEKSRMVNSFLAHQLVEWADGFGLQHQVKMALFKAHFTDARDVSDRIVLGAIAGEAGLDADAALAAIGKAGLASNVRMLQQFWTERGIRGAPTLVFDSQHFLVGARGVVGYKDMFAKLGESSRV